MLTPDQESKALLDPILSVFSAEDGGVAFTKLRHDFLPQMLEASQEGGKAAELVLMVRQFSRMCELMLEK